jgi:hypothetical protein
MANRVLRGPTVLVGEENFVCPDLMEEFREAMEEDQTDPYEIAGGLIEYYADATDDNRLVIDETVSMLCGFKLSTLLQTALAEEGLLTALGIEIPADTKPGEDVDDG